VRWADKKVRDTLERYGSIDYSQLVVGMPCVRTVGVKGDGRSYAYPILVRLIKTLDFMTADGVILPEEIQREIVRVLTQHSQINRVWFDPTWKPPGTTELE